MASSLTESFHNLLVFILDFSSNSAIYIILNLFLAIKIIFQLKFRGKEPKPRKFTLSLCRTHARIGLASFIRNSSWFRVYWFSYFKKCCQTSVRNPSSLTFRFAYPFALSDSIIAMALWRETFYLFWSSFYRCRLTKLRQVMNEVSFHQPSGKFFVSFRLANSIRRPLVWRSLVRFDGISSRKLSSYTA